MSHVFLPQVNSWLPTSVQKVLLVPQSRWVWFGLPPHDDAWDVKEPVPRLAKTNPDTASVVANAL